jgi:hypothetical protein
LKIARHDLREQIKASDFVMTDFGHDFVPAKLTPAWYGGRFWYGSHRFLFLDTNYYGTLQCGESVLYVIYARPTTADYLSPTVKA